MSKAIACVAAGNPSLMALTEDGESLRTVNDPSFLA
jgi:hypothetical protein